MDDSPVTQTALLKVSFLGLEKESLKSLFETAIAEPRSTHFLITKTMPHY